MISEENIVSEDFFILNYDIDAKERGVISDIRRSHTM